MNQEKIGLFIKKLREEKGLTQSELADKLNISDKAVSKWERGINLPDIYNIGLLSELFSISINELLCGEKNPDKELLNNTYSKSVSFYNKLNSKKYIVSLCIIVVSFVIFLLLFFISNFSSNVVYKLESNDSNYIIDGYMVTNHEIKLLFINKLLYQGSIKGTSLDTESSLYNFSLYNDNDVLFDFEKGYDHSISYSELLNELDFAQINSKLNNYNKEFNNLYFIINSDNNSFKINLKYDVIYSNNRIFYNK